MAASGCYRGIVAWLPLLYPGEDTSCILLYQASQRYTQMVMLCLSIEGMNTMYPQGDKSRHPAVVSGRALHVRDRPRLSDQGLYKLYRERRIHGSGGRVIYTLSLM